MADEYAPNGAANTYFTWTTPLDNYEPARRHAKGRGRIYVVDDAEALTLEASVGLELLQAEKLWARSGMNLGVILDDGNNATPWWLAGTAQYHLNLWFRMFPFAPTTSRWQSGPRRFFHLFIEWDK